jgi:hypothetical protein
MKTINYSEKLKDPRWQKKRLEIMQRDDFTCQFCQDKETTLNIHHKRYIAKKEPWEYNSESLITLCEDCHLIMEIAKNSNKDFYNSIAIKIKNKSRYPEIYHVISLKDDTNKIGFHLICTGEDKKLIFNVSFGNYEGVFDKIVDFLNKIKSNG